MNRPALLLADEPTGALDTASGEDVRQLLTDLHADGQTIVLVTHDLALAEPARPAPSSSSTAGSPRTRRAVGAGPMSALGRVVRSGVGRRRVQTVVIGLVGDDRGDRGRARRVAAGGLRARRSTGPSPSSRART